MIQILHHNRSPNLEGCFNYLARKNIHRGCAGRIQRCSSWKIQNSKSIIQGVVLEGFKEVVAWNSHIIGAGNLKAVLKGFKEVVA